VALSKASALAAASDEAQAIRDEVGFFQAIRAALIKSVPGDGKKSTAERELAIQQMVSRAVVSTEIVDIMKAAGLERPDISILSDEFLAEVLRPEVHRGTLPLLNFPSSERLLENLSPRSSFLY
jgi:type I restriction enzyme, R subunit